MIPRRRLDLSWSDLAFGFRACLTRGHRGGDREALAPKVEAWWGPEHESVAVLSVRSGFDLLLRALDLPAGSEIVFSAVTVRDMARIAEANGCVPVAVDVDPDTLSPAADGLEAALTPRTRMIVVAHLCGSRAELADAARLARRCDLLLVEDAAQAFAGPSFKGSDAADVSLFSFGTIKSATALGGGVVRCRDAELAQRIRALQGSQPRQPASEFARRVLKCAALQLLATRPAYTGFSWACRVLRVDQDALIARSVMGFRGDGFFERIRRRPSAPLLALLHRRLHRSRAETFRERGRVGTDWVGRLPEPLRVGATARHNTWWVIPVRVDDPEALQCYLYGKGFDASRGSSSMVNLGEEVGASGGSCPQGQALMREILYLPVYPGVSAAERRRLLDVIESWLDARPVEP